jgi:4-amino-4-deoxy-L-arabinose transferase-like glycosyltransferase
LRLLPLVLLGSLVLNLWNIGWGAPRTFHADEITVRAAAMYHDRNPNPGLYTYGGLPYYAVVVGAVVPVALYTRIFDRPPPLDDPAWAEWDHRYQSRLVPMARAISAVNTTLIVGLTFVIGALLFGSRVGLLAAVLLALSRTFVFDGKVATVDSYANLFVWLSCLGSVLAWKRGDRRWLLLAAVAAGVAIGIKVDRLVAVFPLVAAYLLYPSPRPGLRTVAAAAAAVVLGFVLANPTLVLHTFEFLDGFTRELAFNGLRPREENAGLMQVPILVRFALGTPLFVLSLAGIALGLVRAASGRHRAELAWLLAALLPYWLLFSSRLIEWAYILVLLPAFTIFAAYAGVAAYEQAARAYRPLVATGIAAVAAITLAYTVALITHLEDGNSTRHQASLWLAENVPAGAHVGANRHGPVPLTSTHFRMSEVMPDLRQSELDAFFQVEGAELLESYRPYQTLRSAILGAEAWAGRTLGTRVREQSYVAWFDGFPEAYLPTEEERMLRLARNGPPDVLVLMDRHHFVSVAALQAPGSGYRLAARFTAPQTFGGLTPDLEFISPRISIFRRTDAADWPPSVVVR